jgi:hypothetical protein
MYHYADCGKEINRGLSTPDLRRPVAYHTTHVLYIRIFLRLKGVHGGDNSLKSQNGTCI